MCLRSAPLADKPGLCVAPPVDGDDKDQKSRTDMLLIPIGSTLSLLLQWWQLPRPWNPWILVFSSREGPQCWGSRTLARWGDSAVGPVLWIASTPLLSLLICLEHFPSPPSPPVSSQLLSQTLQTSFKLIKLGCEVNITLQYFMTNQYGLVQPRDGRLRNKTKESLKTSHLRD